MLSVSLRTDLLLTLTKFLKKYEGLDGTELAISESQERMAVVVRAEDSDKFIEYSNNENLEATKVAVCHRRKQTCYELER